MSKHSYLAVFRSCKEGGYWVEFPDWNDGPICGATDGRDEEEAIFMATDLLNLMCWECEHSNLKFPEKKEFVLDKNETAKHIFTQCIFADTEKYDITMQRIQKGKYRFRQIRKAREMIRILKRKNRSS